jgi:hypothetical protein
MPVYWGNPLNSFIDVLTETNESIFCKQFGWNAKFRFGAMTNAILSPIQRSALLPRL